MPTNINTAISVLRRKADDAATISLRLKRRLSNQQHCMYNTVRLKQVLHAMKYLVENSSLYKNIGIMIDGDWEYSPPEDPEESDSHTSEKSEEELDGSLMDDIPVGYLDTMMQPSDMSQEARRVITVAPGEGDIPLSIFMDKYSEKLAFPYLFLWGT